MKPERWQRIEEIFRTVVDRPTAEREALLTRVCGEDAELRHQVTSLLACETADDFLRGPIRDAARSLTGETNDDLTGTRIGVYSITRLIGRGGMGAVYEAQRDDEQFQQQVAIKIIKRGMDTDFIRDRFLRERRILASLDHPLIARMFDGGTTPDGLPYFVMEYVDGEPITDYCRRAGLSVAERVRLFRAVLPAVQHAHQKLIIHRDLKPSNILITKDGAPKLLDFGIAKLLSPDPGETPTRTETGLRLMTPDYASPEQVRGHAAATTTDVYSLGVVLYELLTERRPYEFRTSLPAEIERAICETGIEEPSKVVARMAGEPARRARRLSGDLDNIVMMAMRKEPERRYPSVEQFSEDLRRHLVGLPVVARKDTFGYRAGKFVRRNKAGVAILALLGVLVVAMAVQAARIARERDRANQEAAAARAVTQSLVAMFEFADPGRSRGNVITARELLDQGAERVVRELNDQPLVQARLMDTIGQLYQSIGFYDRAQPLLEESLRIRRRMLGPEHVDVAATLKHLGDVVNLKGDYAASEALFRESLAMRRRLLGNAHPDVAESLSSLGALLVTRGNYPEAEVLLREGLAIRRNLYGEEHTAVAESLNSLGRLLSDQGKLGDAASLYRQALAIRRKLYGGEHPLVALNLNNLAAMLQELSDYDGAEAMFREALTMRRKLLGEEHPDTIVSMANLASALQDMRKYDESEQLYRQVLALRRKLLGEDHPKLAITMNNLATMLRDKGDYEKAEPLFRQALAMRRRQLGAAHPDVGGSLNGMGLMFHLKGDYAEAERTQRQAIEVFLKSLKPDNWMVHRSRSNLGASLVKLKRHREAEAQLLAAHAGLKAALGEGHAHTRLAVNRLIELYVSWQKTEMAAPYRALAQAAPNAAKK
ncbi:MAG: serine/threonine-protein kinase [Blastocatellia bacterium]|nr:serine/threonine-protein kinase [Blastocatellia bacterium]